MVGSFMWCAGFARFSISAAGARGSSVEPAYKKTHSSGHVWSFVLDGMSLGDKAASGLNY